MRLAALGERKAATWTTTPCGRALLAHLCRCTGWRTILEAARRVGADAPPRGPCARRRPVPGRGPRRRRPRRAALEGDGPQAVGAARGAAAAGASPRTRAPADALVAVPDGRGGWVRGRVARRGPGAAERVPGRNSTVALRHPLERSPRPVGPHACGRRSSSPPTSSPTRRGALPGGEPVTPLANGGAFGGKVTLPGGRGGAASGRRARAGRVRVVFSREDVVRYGPKRPPVAAGRAGRRDRAWCGWRGHRDRADLDRWVQAVSIGRRPGSWSRRWRCRARRCRPTCGRAGWAEAAVLLAALEAPSPRRRPGPAVPSRCGPRPGPRATVDGRADGARCRCRWRRAMPLDEVVLRSYVVGAVHQALGWVRSEGVAVDDDGDGARPHHPVLRDPPGPGHARGGGGGGGR